MGDGGSFTDELEWRRYGSSTQRKRGGRSRQAGFSACLRRIAKRGSSYVRHSAPVLGVVADTPIRSCQLPPSFRLFLTISQTSQHPHLLLFLHPPRLVASLPPVSLSRVHRNSSNGRKDHLEGAAEPEEERRAVSRVFSELGGADGVGGRKLGAGEEGRRVYRPSSFSPRFCFCSHLRKTSSFD